MPVREYGKVLVYPPSGRLLFATDFHGQLRDFERISSVFSARRARGEDLYLLFAGDFIHGPAPGQRGRWLEADDSPALLDALQALLDAHPGRVHALLGNHEHAHLGGAPTQKFYRGADNDVAALHRRLGAQAAEAARQLFRTFSLLALTPCGVVFSHAAPALTPGPDLLQRIAEARVDRRDPVVLQLTWPRIVPPDQLDAVLASLCVEDIRPSLSAYGHEIIPVGVDRSEHRQIVVSTSFAVDDRVKTFIELDLAARYDHLDDLHPGQELRRLYPTAQG